MADTVAAETCPVTATLPDWLTLPEVSNLVLFRLLKLSSNSWCVRAEPLPDLVVIVVICVLSPARAADYYLPERKYLGLL